MLGFNPSRRMELSARMCVLNVLWFCQHCIAERGGVANEHRTKLAPSGKSPEIWQLITECLIVAFLSFPCKQVVITSAIVIWDSVIETWNTTEFVYKVCWNLNTAEFIYVNNQKYLQLQQIVVMFSLCC